MQQTGPFVRREIKREGGLGQLSFKRSFIFPPALLEPNINYDVN